MICPNCKETFDELESIWYDPNDTVYCSEECLREGWEYEMENFFERYPKRVYGKLSYKELEAKYDSRI